MRSIRWLVWLIRFRKECDNVGFFYDASSHPHACLVVRLTLDTSFLDSVTAKQWGIIPKKAIVVQLKFDWNFLLSENVPAVLIFQSEDPQLNKVSLDDYETEFGVVQVERMSKCQLKVSVVLDNAIERHHRIQLEEKANFYSAFSTQGADFDGL